MLKLTLSTVSLLINFWIEKGYLQITATLFLLLKVLSIFRRSKLDISSMDTNVKELERNILGIGNFFRKLKLFEKNCFVIEFAEKLAKPLI